MASNGNILHGTYGPNGAERYCAECEEYVSLTDWQEHRDHGDYRISRGVAP